MIHLKIKLFCISFFLFFSGQLYAQSLQVETLPPPSLDSVGLYPAAFNTWGTYPMSPLEGIINNLTQDRSSVFLNQMTATVLASSTLYVRQEEADQGVWLALRIKGLFDLARFNDVVQLIDAIPSYSQRVPFLPFYFNALLMQNELDKACLVSQSQNSRNDFWQKADILCLTFGEDIEKARLAYELWRERFAHETLFSDLISHQLYGTSFQVEHVSSVTPIDAFLIQKLGVKGISFETIPPFMKPIEKVSFKQGFKNAVNLKNLKERWGKQQISPEEQTLRLIQLSDYLNVFHPDVYYMYKNRVFDEGTINCTISPLVVFLYNKKSQNITGADVLMALEMLQENTANLLIAFNVLKFAGFDALVEQWMLERIS